VGEILECRNHARLRCRPGLGRRHNLDDGEHGAGGQLEADPAGHDVFAVGEFDASEGVGRRRRPAEQRGQGPPKAGREAFQRRQRRVWNLGPL
jgi:hypothetical protein